jgi:hypothetical protein
VAIGTGSKSFTTQASKSFDVGVFLVISSAATPSAYMTGQVTAYSGTSLTVNVTKTGGSGTKTDWNIYVAGRPGDAGVGTIQPFVGCQITGVSQSITTSGGNITFDSESIDTDSFHNTAADTDEIAISSDYDDYFFDFTYFAIIDDPSGDADLVFTLNITENGVLQVARKVTVHLNDDGVEKNIVVPFGTHKMGWTGGFGAVATIHAQVVSGNSGNAITAPGHRLDCRLIAAPTDSAGSVVFPSYTDSSRPAATAVQAGTAIWNTDDGFPNWSNGTNWVISDGTTT